MRRICLLFSLILLLSCDPYNLERINFNNCVPPSALVGATVTKLQAELFAERPTGEAGTINWTFGDGRGLPQRGTRVTYLYDRPGSYTVTMTITNRCNQTFTATRTIAVAN